MSEIKSPSLNKRTALILSGGWDGHEPEVSTARYQTALQQLDFAVTVLTEVEALLTLPLQDFNLIVPNWTMGQMSNECAEALCKAVESGVGLAGIHGGMGDSFRGNLNYQWLVGGQFLGHPHVGPFTVCRTAVDHCTVADWPDSFEYDSEQYYMMVDPDVTVLADSVYRFQGRTCRMPITWVRNWGKGRVFYSSLGHKPSVEFDKYPLVFESVIKGFLWAARDN